MIPTIIVIALLIVGGSIICLFHCGSSHDSELNRYANHIRRQTLIEEIADEAIAANLSPWKRTCLVDDLVMARFNLRPVNQVDGDYLLLVDYASRVFEEIKSRKAL
tara:strand:+ start:4302 stop:4619 length:318 start_codon:yes stop_codon:yes gene_type:complete